MSLCDQPANEFVAINPLDFAAMASATGGMIVQFLPLSGSGSNNLSAIYTLETSSYSDWDTYLTTSSQGFIGNK